MKHLCYKYSPLRQNFFLIQSSGPIDHGRDVLAGHPGCVIFRRELWLAADLWFSKEKAWGIISRQLLEHGFLGRGVVLASDKYTILLADDHVLIRHGIKNIIKLNEELEVIGEVGNGQELMECLQTQTPDLVILDISMPKISGIEAASLIKKKYPQVKILILTMHKKLKIKTNSIFTTPCLVVRMDT